MHVRPEDRLSLLSDPRQSLATEVAGIAPEVAPPRGWTWRRGLKATVYSGLGVLGGVSALAVALLLFGPDPRSPDAPKDGPAPTLAAAPAPPAPRRLDWIGQARATLAALHEEIDRAADTLGGLRAQELALLQSLTGPAAEADATGPPAPRRQVPAPAVAPPAATPPPPAAPPTYAWTLGPPQATPPAGSADADRHEFGPCRRRAGQRRARASARSAAAGTALPAAATPPRPPAADRRTRVAPAPAPPARAAPAPAPPAPAPPARALLARATPAPAPPAPAPPARATPPRAPPARAPPPRATRARARGNGPAGSGHAVAASGGRRAGRQRGQCQRGQRERGQRQRGRRERPGRQRSCGRRQRR